MFGISSFSGFIQLYFNVPSSITLIVLFNMGPRDTTETIESGPLCITDLFQNKSVAYFKFIIFFPITYQKKKLLYFMQLFSADTTMFLKKLKIIF